MCEYMDTIKDVLDELIEDELTFSAYDVTSRVRDIVGKGTNVEHSVVRGAVAALMANEDSYVGDFNGKFVEFKTIYQQPAQGFGPQSAPQTVAQSSPPPPPNFGDPTVELEPGEKITIEFASPVTKITVSQ